MLKVLEALNFVSKERFFYSQPFLIKLFSFLCTHYLSLYAPAERARQQRLSELVSISCGGISRFYGLDMER